MKILIDQNESNGIVLHLNHERHVLHIDFNNLSFFFWILKKKKTSKHSDVEAVLQLWEWFSMFVFVS